MDSTVSFAGFNCSFQNNAEIQESSLAEESPAQRHTGWFTMPERLTKLADG